MARFYEKAPTRHIFPVTDFGGGADILYYVKGPKGKAGRLYDYGVEGLTEAMNGGTLMPGMAVGIVGTAAKYGVKFVFTSMAIADGTKSIRSTYTPIDTAFEGTYMVERDLPADTVVMVTCYAATGSALTGTGTPFVDIIWDD